MRKTVSIEFRNLVKEIYPGLGNNKAYWAFMRYLLFTTHKDERGGTVIPRERLAFCEGKIKTLADDIKRYSGVQFLERFLEDVFNGDGTKFMWSSYNSATGEARVASVNWDSKLELALKDEVFKTMDITSRVYFETGNKFSEKAERVQRAISKLEADKYFDFSDPAARPILNYMNNLGTNAFSKIVEANWDEAFLVASKLKDKKRVGERRRINTELLFTIQEELVPLYKGSEKGNTVRIYPFNNSIPQLSKAVRKVLCKGWWEADLKSSQLAIVATLWDVKELQDYLAAGNSIWSDLLAWVGCNEPKGSEEYEEIKGALKDALYTVIYGGGRERIKEDLVDKLEDEMYFTKFMSHPIVSILYKARDARKKWLLNGGVITTKLGKELKVTETAAKNKDAQARSIMAQEAQAAEMWLMLPIIDLAKDSKDFTVTIWQHDGVSISFHNATKLERVKGKINQAVLDRAEEGGFLTYLEWEQL